MLIYGIVKAVEIYGNSEANSFLMNFKFATAVDLSKCLKQIKITISTHAHSPKA